MSDDIKPDEPVEEGPPVGLGLLGVARHFENLPVETPESPPPDKEAA